MGPINRLSKQKYYILVCTDYVTKWVEARDLLKETYQYVLDFLFEEIFSPYGIPRRLSLMEETSSHEIE